MVQVPATAPLAVDEDAALCVLRTDRAPQGVFVSPVPATWRMAAAEDAAVLAHACASGLELAPLLGARLPQVVTLVAEVRRAEAEVVRLSFAAVAALPSKELRSVLGALELALRGAPSADEFHGQRRLHVVVEVILALLVRPRTFGLATIIRLSTLRALVKGHFVHGEAGYPILVRGVARLRGGPALLDGPTLQRLPPHLLI
mmetsp:Transcript_26777/g.77333  ORF Transcript_26777/g.77333 Transcript_26777/m.77333 type:complete len:202 (-) Transcript_26777:1432-2037(-)